MIVESATVEPSAVRSLPLDVAKIRSDFPIFHNRLAYEPFSYLDSAATSQTPRQVVESVTEYYSDYNANVHRAIYAIGEKATQAYESSRERVSRFIGAEESRSVVFTRGTTEAINLVAYAWARHNLREGDEILITEMEHHSNLVPWQLAARDTGSTLKYIPFGSEGTLENIESYFTERTKIVSVIHQSNVFGTVNPVERIISLAKSVGALTLIDAAQSVPHFSVDVSSLDCDFLAFSGHKMLGPTGVGVLYGKPDLLEQMEPFLGGGEMIQTVTLEESTWNDVPWKFEAGTPNIAQAIGLGAAVDFLSEIGMDTIHEHEKIITDYALKKLSEVEEVTIYGTPSERGGVITFNLESVHPHDLAQILDRDGVAIRAGHHCAQPIMEKLGIVATARASFYLYNDFEDVDRLLASVEKSIDFLR